MDRDVVNALHALYQHGETDAATLLSRLWCGPDSEPDLDDLAEKTGDKLRLSPYLIKFIKATEKQMSNLPRPDFVFGYPLSQRPRKQGEPRPAFIAMPYGPIWFKSVCDVIVSAVSASGFAPEVSKDLETPGQITDQIWHGIRRADVVIADISESNPNVFYELGLAHALGKEVVITAQGVERPPFDVSTARLLRYELTDLPSLETKLLKACASVSARYAYEGPQPYF
ncbi:MAG TPA: hypothetical protein VGQ39_06305 [Pyrinomonadaceae bacterium]|jgi:hypothetical protein|nr:hypothetical protein [Pyrinomonadaceae bacterium]